MTSRQYKSIGINEVEKFTQNKRQSRVVHEFSSTVTQALRVSPANPARSHSQHVSRSHTAHSLQSLAQSQVLLLFPQDVFFSFDLDYSSTELMLILPSELAGFLPYYSLNFYFLIFFVLLLLRELVFDVKQLSTINFYLYKTKQKKVRLLRQFHGRKRLGGRLNVCFALNQTQFA